MLFGYNTDVKVGDLVYHVQTEDRGIANALIDTTVYCRGRVLHRRTDNYYDLLPLDAERESLLRKRLDAQHRDVAEELRTGALQLTPPPSGTAQKTPTTETAGDRAAQTEASPTGMLDVELINAKTWLSGKRANLHVVVRRTQNGERLADAFLTARIDGAAALTEFSTETGPDGEARLEFEMPALVGAEPALVIEATRADARGLLKFQLKTRPRVPAAQEK